VTNSTEKNQVHFQFHSIKTSENIETGSNGTEIFLGNVPEHLEIIEFPKSEEFYNEKIKWKGNFQGNVFGILGLPHHFFSEIT